MNIAVILPAAGLGKRFSTSMTAAGPLPLVPSSDPATRSANKIEMDLAGKPVFLHAVECFLNRPNVRQILLAVNPDTVQEFRLRWGDRLTFHGVKIIPGGKAERWETVLKALDQLDDEITHVAIHDAARPLASASLIDRVFAAAQEHPAVIPAVPVSATLKRAEPIQPTPTPTRPQADSMDAILGQAGKPMIPIRKIVATVDRANLMEVQTPQVFQRTLLLGAYQPIASGKLSGKGITDDAALIEALGQRVIAVDGETTNLKITRPEDLEIAQALMALRQQKQAKATARQRLFGDDE